MKVKVEETLDRSKLGLVMINTGDGKGKTTAAVGLALRAKGTGMNVKIVQFLKGSDTGEVSLLRELGIEVTRLPHDCGFWKYMSDEEKAEVSRYHDALLEDAISCVASGDLDMLVLDEIAGALKNDSVNREACIDLLKNHGHVELILTGRGFDDEVLGYGDYITEMKKIKHPFDQKIMARKGIEY